MSAKTKPLEIDRAALVALMARVEHAITHELALSVDDMKLLLSAISTLATLQTNIDQKDVTLNQLRKLLGMIQSSESKRSANGSSKNRKNKNIAKPRKPKKDKPEPKVEHHLMQDQHKGDACPECSCGKLYKFDPAQLLRITGQAPYEATQHISERLRCNACLHVYTAPLPESVLEDGDANQKYGYSARSLMVIDKFYTGTPYYHQSNLADMFGYAISASTIFDQCEHVCNDVMPVYFTMQSMASNSDSFLIDDTHHRILDQKPQMLEVIAKPEAHTKEDNQENKESQKSTLRKGVFCSGLIAQCLDDHDIILFETSLGHAGEHLHSLLKKRDHTLTKPLLMCDALSRNTVTHYDLELSYCNAHARRKFYDVEHLQPTEIEWLLHEYAGIWTNEHTIQEKNMSDAERLEYHRKNSLPLMQNIQQWAQNHKDRDDFEEHSAFGKAINYFLKHYTELSKFCSIKGALIDNNRMEEKLKMVIRGRKTAHFYKTAVGASVANVLISIMATCDQARVNVYDYLIALQRHRALVKENPSQWMPWNFQATIENIPKKFKPDK